MRQLHEVAAVWLRYLQSLTGAGALSSSFSSPATSVFSLSLSSTKSAIAHQNSFSSRKMFEHKPQIDWLQ